MEVPCTSTSPGGTGAIPNSITNATRSNRFDRLDRKHKRRFYPPSCTKRTPRSLRPQLPDKASLRAYILLYKRYMHLSSDQQFSDCVLGNSLRGVSNTGQDMQRCVSRSIGTPPITMGANTKNPRQPIGHNPRPSTVDWTSAARS